MVEETMQGTNLLIRSNLGVQGLAPRTPTLGKPGIETGNLSVFKWLLYLYYLAIAELNLSNIT